MQAVGTIIVVGCLIGSWWLVVKRMKSKGRGFLIRHLVGSTIGSLTMVVSAVVLVAAGVMEDSNTVAATTPTPDEAPVAVPPATVTAVKAPTAEQQEPPKSTSATEAEYDLDLTATDFVANMNIALPLAGIKVQLPHKPTIISGEVNDAYRGSINQYLQIMATISKASGNIKSVTLIAAGDGSPESGANVIIAGVAVYMAASDMATTEGKKPNTDLFMDLLNRVMETKDTSSKVVGGRNYSITPMGDLGTWISVEAVN